MDMTLKRHVSLTFYSYKTSIYRKSLFWDNNNYRGVIITLNHFWFYDVRNIFLKYKMFVIITSDAMITRNFTHFLKI